MRVLIIHNRYRETGGEDTVVEQETRLLRDHDDPVALYELTNHPADRGFRDTLAMPVDAIWSRRSVQGIKQLIASHRPDVAHIHNTHFRVSLGAVRACDEMGVPVAMTLHNYRLLCPAATLFRSGAVCEDCLGKAVAYPGVIHRCWRDSALQTAAVAAANAVHGIAGTLERVARFIAPSEFTKRKFVEAGFDSGRIVTRPHFLSFDPQQASVENTEGFVSVGRLSEEKGTDVLLRAWQDLGDVPLRIIGNGPLRPLVESFIAAHGDAEVESMGFVEHTAALHAMKAAIALVYPSSCYETFGMAALEASALGRPTIVSDHGAPAELVDDGVTGICFRAGDPDSLVEAVRALWADREEAKAMGLRARLRFEESAGADMAYRTLLDAYESAIAART